jgi:hypothetical protein
MRECAVVAERDAERTGEIHDNAGCGKRAPMKELRDECAERPDMNRAQTNTVDPSADSIVHRLTVAGARREAVAAVNRFVAARLERYFRYAAALAAGRLEHFALSAAAATRTAAAAAAGSFARCAAIAATAGLIRKAFARIEFLFACREREAASAIDASEGFIAVHE